MAGRGTRTLAPALLRSTRAILVSLAAAALVAVTPGTLPPVAATSADHAAPSGGPIAAAPGDRPATELRVALGRLLGEHAYLLMESMRATADGAPDADAIEARLGANSDALAAAIGDVYGTEARNAFRPLWQRHIDAARAYARGVAAGDDAAMASAAADLEAFRGDLDRLLQQANPKLDAEDEAHAIALHLEQLEAFAQGDYAAGYRAAREAYQHMFALGDSLAQAIAEQDPETYPDQRVAFSPASALRLLLDRLLGEHLILAAEAMRAGVADAPNLAAARQALDANTADLVAAVTDVYGDEAGVAFEEVWTAHLSAYLDYIDAVQSSDSARQEAARQTLEAYGARFGTFISGANPLLAEEDVAELIRHHTAALLEMVDQYRDGDYDAAYQTVGEAYEHMFTVGDALAAAIAAQDPDRFKDLADLPKTDASSPSRPSPLVVVVLPLAFLLGVVAWLRRVPREARPVPAARR